MRVVAARVDDGDSDPLPVDGAVKLGLHHQFLSPTQEGPCVVAWKCLTERTQADHVEPIRRQLNITKDQIPIVLPGFGQHRLRAPGFETVEWQSDLPALIADSFRRQAGSEEQNSYLR